MKTHFYQTNVNHMIAEKRLFNNAQKNDWISTVMVDKTPVSDSFSGFGVAITGSSCYELSIMPPTQRDEFLSDIYGKDVLKISGYFILIHAGLAGEVEGRHTAEHLFS